MSFVVELLGALVLFDLRWEAGSLNRRPGTVMHGLVAHSSVDSKSSSFAVSKMYTGREPGASLLRALAARCHDRDCLLRLDWLSREENTWADDLSKMSFQGFDMSKRARVHWETYRPIQEDLESIAWSTCEL